MSGFLEAAANTFGFIDHSGPDPHCSLNIVEKKVGFLWWRKTVKVKGPHKLLSANIKLGAFNRYEISTNCEVCGEHFDSWGLRRSHFLDVGISKEFLDKADKEPEGLVWIIGEKNED